jgi:hypothetical protein
VGAREFADTFGYELVAFNAVDSKGRVIYHTNVIMSIGSKFAVICTEALDRDCLTGTLDSLSSFREVMDIGWDQTIRYCGNVLELSTDSGAVVAMSKTAYDGFSDMQIEMFWKLGVRPIVADIGNIERVAGGSVRCMLAEVFQEESSEEAERPDFDK